MGINEIWLVYDEADESHRPRIKRWMPPHVLERELNKIYGQGNWCMLIDEAYFRLALPGAKNDTSLAVKGVREATDALAAQGCVAATSGRAQHFFRVGLIAS